MIDIDKKKITKQIKNGEPINLRFKFIYEDILLLLNSIIVKILSNRDQIFLINSIITILREIVVNAIKANAKRVFFEKRNLNIIDTRNYLTGMEQFKNEIIGEFDLIKSDLEMSKYYVSLDIDNTPGQLSLMISNNVQILSEELNRINYRINKAKKYNDFTDVYSEIEDNTEGAGLGIVLTILFLKNMGISPDNFSIKSKGDITTTTLIIPQKLRPDEITIPVKKHILNEIEGIPTFPKNIIELQRLCQDPESSIDEISKRIKADPALSSDVIKLSNSAGFVPGKRILSINDAVMTIGLKNVNAILIASNARQILNARYNKFEQVWEHCNKTAFYARQITLKNRLPNNILENAFLAGLLHDLGKIILLATDMKLVKRIAHLVKNRKIISSTIMEEISIGLSHSTIGALVSKKWNFPDYLIESIQHHHSPLSTKPKFANLVQTVYLANIMCGIEIRKYSYNYVDESVLKNFNLTTEDKFNALGRELMEKYSSNLLK